MGILDLERFTFNGDVLRAVSELAFDEVIKGVDLNMLHTIYPNIVTQKEIGFVGKGGLVGVANQGCNPNAQDWSVGTRIVKFEPVAWEILINACWTDLEASAAVYALHKGIGIADFTDTDYMTILLEVLTNAMNEFMYRVVWFSDVDAADQEDLGTLTNGVNPDYFNLLDGFFKQMEMHVAMPENHKQLVAIQENQSGAYHGQRLLNGVAKDYLRDAYNAAPIQLRSQKNKFFLVTQTVYDSYVEALQSVTALETTYKNLVNGMETVSYNGIPVIPMPIWDEIIASYYDTGVNHISPHRIVFTSPEVLAVGVDDPNAFDSVQSWYNKDTRQVKIEAMGKCDAKLANPALFVYGY